jgi:hypothetical protein
MEQAIGKITKEQFFNEIIYFRELMGSKSFWELPLKQRDNAVAGLATTYILVNTSNKEEIEECAQMFESAKYEYDRREQFLLFHPMHKEKRGEIAK